MKAKYIYDYAKGMWYRHSSSCCGAVLEQKMLFQNKPVKPGFKMTTSTQVPRKETVKRKWYQIWKPKTWEITVGRDVVTTHKKVQFRYYCTECGKRASVVGDFVHEDRTPQLNPNKGVSGGQLALSKSASVGSSPATPAKKVKK